MGPELVVFISSFHLGFVWKCCVPRKTQWFCWSLSLHIPTKWLFHWGYTPFSDIPIWGISSIWWCWAASVVDSRGLAGVYFDIFGNLMPGNTPAGAFSSRVAEMMDLPKINGRRCGLGHLMSFSKFSPPNLDVDIELSCFLLLKRTAIQLQVDSCGFEQSPWAIWISPCRNERIRKSRGLGTKMANHFKPSGLSPQLLALVLPPGWVPLGGPQSSSEASLILFASECALACWNCQTKALDVWNTQIVTRKESSFNVEEKGLCGSQTCKICVVYCGYLWLFGMMRVCFTCWVSWCSYIRCWFSSSLKWSYTQDISGRHIYMHTWEFTCI